MNAQTRTPDVLHPLSSAARAQHRTQRSRRPSSALSQVRHYQLEQREEQHDRMHIQSTAIPSSPLGLQPGDGAVIDASLLGVVIRLAALAVVLLIVPMELPMLVHPLLRSAIICTGTITFALCFWALNRMYEVFLRERRPEFCRVYRLSRWLAPHPLWLLQFAIRFFGLAMLLLVTGIFLQWFVKWGWIG
jgi:hypothetical protein